MDLIPIRVNTLRANSNITFDLYIEIGERHIHYRRIEDLIEGDDLARMKAKKLKKLYIQPEQETDYLAYLDAGLQASMADDKPLEERSKIVQGTMTTLAENAERHFETEQGFRNTESQFEKVATFLQSDKNALKSILSAAGTSMEDHQHSATVSSLCMAVASKIGITDQKEIMELSLAAIVHDVGKGKLKIDTKQSFKDMNAQDKAQYQRHPQIALEILSGKPFITPRILGLVASHEELAFGKGYPEKKNLLELPQSYQILSLCNRFEHFCSENNIPHAQGIDPFFESNEKLFDQDMIMVLSTVLA